MRSRDFEATRLWSWAASDVEVDVRHREATKLVGHRVQAVRYVTLDYRRNELYPELIGSGPRWITDDTEVAEPTWRDNGFDDVDFGVEIVTESGLSFSITWDPPGAHEGIGIQGLPLLGSGLPADADVAVWTVSDSVTWASTVGSTVTSVDLRYVPWKVSDGSLWCQHITLRCGHDVVDILLGGSENGVLSPAADNVAVLHQRSALPPWTH